MLAFSACILIGSTMGLRLTLPAFLVALGLAVAGAALLAGGWTALLTLLALQIGYPLGMLLRLRLDAARPAPIVPAEVPPTA